MKRMAFSSSCLVTKNGNILIDPDFSEEQSSLLNQSEHFLVYDPSDFNRSISMNHFGKFDLSIVSKVSKVLIESSIKLICEQVKNEVKIKIENL